MPRIPHSYEDRLCIFSRITLTCTSTIISCSHERFEPLMRLQMYVCRAWDSRPRCGQTARAETIRTTVQRPRSSIATRFRRLWMERQKGHSDRFWAATTTIFVPTWTRANTIIPIRVAVAVVMLMIFRSMLLRNSVQTAAGLSAWPMLMWKVGYIFMCYFHFCAAKCT